MMDSVVEVEADEREERETEASDGVNKLQQTRQKRRIASVYDAVAGRVGLNGFLTPEQQNSSNITPLRPEEVLLRRVNAPAEVASDYYNADQRLSAAQTLPDSDMLKDIHAYISAFYSLAVGTNNGCDYRSLDETALLALGILLEEASKEALGEDGDMVFTESEGLDRKGYIDDMAEHQIVGKVVPKAVVEYQSSSSEEEQEIQQKRKRRRYRYGGDNRGDDDV